ncbi:MAG: hypothetical protein RLY20_410 [Verrucomicrobiota bacterium]|jgi:hypothetical protein
MNWNQLKTILWLRWRLTRNQLFRGSAIGGVLLIILGFICVTAVLAICGGAAFAGFMALRTVKPEVLQAVWTVASLAFAFLWFLGLLVELQRSETIDLQRLMHLPVRLGQVFVINYIASHAVFSIFMLVPGMVGLALGLTFGRNWMFILLLPLVLSGVFMITAWTYCLRGWLATLMANPRRRRTVIMCLSLCLVLIGQAPNLYLNVFGRMNHSSGPMTQEAKAKETQKLWEKLSVAERFIPPLWLPLGAKALAEDNPFPALLGTLGCFAIGGLGLRRAYCTTVKFYHGDSSKGSGKPSPAPEGPKPARKPRHSRLTEIKLPSVPEPASAIAGATLRSMLRAPEVKMALGTSTLVTVILSATLLVRAAPKIPDAAKPLMLVGACSFTLFMLFQFLANQFGLDRDGFRVLVLSPIDRRHLLLGKNLAIAPIAASFGVTLITALTFWLHVPILAAVAGLLQLFSMVLIFVSVGNLISILLPFRIQAGSMKPTKPPFLKMLGLVACQFLVPVFLLPAALPPLAEYFWHSANGTLLLPVNLILSATLAVIAAISYGLSLQPLANLYSRRELAILKSVTAEEE